MDRNVTKLCWESGKGIAGFLAPYSIFIILMLLPFLLTPGCTQQERGPEPETESVPETVPEPEPEREPIPSDPWVVTIDGIANISNMFYDMEVDSVGNVYFSYDRTFNDDDREGNIILSKISPDGDLVWSNNYPEFGKFDPIYIYPLVGLINESCIFAGTYWDEIDFDLGPEISMAHPDDSIDSFILSLDNDGNFEWVTTWESSKSENAIRNRIPFANIHGMCISNSGTIVVVGSYNQKIQFEDDSEPIELDAQSGYGNLYIAAIDTDGNFIFEISFSGYNYRNGINLNVETDIYNNIYLLYPCLGNSCDFDPGPGTTSTYGGNYRLLVKFNDDGHFEWYRELHGNHSEFIIDGGFIQVVGTPYDNETSRLYPLVIYDLEGNIMDEIILDSIIPSAGIYDMQIYEDSVYLTGICGGKVSSYVTSYIIKYNETGKRLWDYRFGNDDIYSNVIPSIEIDDYGNLYITGGYQNEVVFPDCFGIENLPATENWSTYLIKLDLDDLDN